MKRTINLPAAAFAGLVTTGLLAMPISSAFAADDVAMKRDDDGTELVAVHDDDDGDDDNDDNDTGTGNDTGTNTGTNTGATNTGTGTGTGDQNDATNSVSTGVSQDRDVSQSDLTRDMTDDGAGPEKRDWSANATNDRSRNDTRG